ncbi:hypothetical protein LIA77_11879 [Sarocladium implicatum]|nr:hypothetical protein LIA77_11879 [Sarocladium implicatum]
MAARKHRQSDNKIFDMTSNVTTVDTTTTLSQIRLLADTIWSHHYDANGQPYESPGIWVSLSTCDLFLSTFGFLLLLAIMIVWLENDVFPSISVSVLRGRRTRQRLVDAENGVEMRLMEMDGHERHG